MRILKAICERIDRIIECEGKGISWLVIVLMGLTCYEVFLRRILGSPTIWTHEILAYVFGAHWVLALGYTELHKGHSNVDLITSRFSKKTQTIISIIGLCLFLGAICVVWVWQGTIYCAKSWAMLERAPSAFNSPVYPAKTIIPVGFFVLGMIAVRELISDIVFLVKKVRL